MTRSRRRKLERIRAAKAPGAVNRTLRISVGLGLAPLLVAGLPVANAQQTAATPIGGLEEIVVTATKREENLQSVPVSITAFSTARLEELNVVQFEDYVKFLPSVSYQTFGPGFAQVYMRGVVSGGDGNHSGSQPSVGIYLDEQPITTIQGALDVNLYDIQRVEALAGPQGTLYGASSQSGTLRIITNKPDTTAFDASYTLEGNTVSGGDQGYTAEGFVNIPLFDKAAVRLVGWARHDAGYIDNVRSTRVFPGNGFVVDNSKFVEDNFNDADTYGGRLALKIDLNDSWTITPTVMTQNQEANGVYGYDRTLGELKVAHAFPDKSQDNWIQSALTIEGKISNFDIVYAGSYLDRDVDTQSDYSDYSYWYDVAYQASGYNFSSYFYDNAGDPIDISQYIQGHDSFRRTTHELRLTSPQDWRFRFTVGAFYQDARHMIEQRYLINNLADSISVTGWPNTIWLTQQVREDKDKALFGEVSFDIFEKLTATAGIRYFESDNSLKGFFGYSAGFSSKTGESQCFDQTDFNEAPCINLDRSTDQKDHTVKFNLTYKFDDERMVYATYAEGFRPGGINRRGTLPPYQPDFLKSYELGWKTTWLDNRVRFNGAVFTQNWDNFQYSLLGANGLTEITNAAEAEINGIEADLTWIVTDRFSLTAGASFLDSKLKKPYCGFVDPNTLEPVSQDPCPTFDEDTGQPTGEFVPPEAPKDQNLPVMPDIKANLTGRYKFPVGTFDAYLQGAVVYVGERDSDLRTIERDIIGKLPSYTLVDLSAGIARNSWSLDLIVSNAFDETAESTRFAQCAETICGQQTYSIIQAPRKIALRFSQNF